MKLMNGTTPAHGTSLEDVATACFLALKDDDLSPSDWKAWVGWLQECEEHQKAFDEVARLWDKLNGVLPVEVPSLAEMAADNMSDVDQDSSGHVCITPVVKTQHKVARPFNNWTQAAIAASAVFVMLMGSFQFGFLDGLFHDRKILETRVSQTMKTELADGSRIMLDGDTRIEIDYSNKFRRVTLARGRALFEVAKDATRPFIVNAGNGDTTAVGTRFEVNKLSSLVSVTVTEGLVKVSSVSTPRSGAHSGSDIVASTLLGAGEQVSYSNQAGLQKIKHINAESVGVWRDGLHTLIDEPMCQAIEEINRHASRRIYYRDDEICEFNISGTVNLSRPDEWLAGLEKGYPLKVIPAGQNSVLLSRIREDDVPKRRAAR